MWSASGSFLRSVSLAATAIGYLCAFAGSAAAQSGLLPPVVAAAIEENKKVCDSKVTLGPGFVAMRDINGDGRADYILDYGAYSCGESSTFFCGTAGCLTQVFASLRDGSYVK